MSVVVTEANASERLGAIVALSEQCCDAKVLEFIWADSGYSGENFAAAVMSVCGAKVEVVKRIKDGFDYFYLEDGWLKGLLVGALSEIK